MFQVWYTASVIYPPFATYCSIEEGGESEKGTYINELESGEVGASTQTPEGRPDARDTNAICDIS